MNFIYTTKHVNTPEEYINALLAGYVNVKIPKEQDEALFVLLQERKDEHSILLREYANRLLLGEGCEKDPDTAFSLLLTLTVDGFTPAINSVGWCYDQGQGVPQDDKKTVEWYTKAAEQGYANAQNNLGVCYKRGQGVPQDYKKAVEWYTKAAEQGHARAQTNLGCCYEAGYGVPQDYKKAAEWYTKAGKKEDAARCTRKIT